MSETNKELSVTVSHASLVHAKRLLDRAMKPDIEFNLNDSEVKLLKKVIRRVSMHIRDAQLLIEQMIV